MRFGLLYEAQRPFKGTSIDWNKLYKETLEQCVLADKVGFDDLWFVEHHFLTGFSGSPCPEVLLGALSQITKRIRIGFGVCILPYSPPDPRGRARRHARSADRRPARVRDRALQRLRADRAGHRSPEHARDVGRVDHDDPAHLAIGRVLVGRAPSGRCPSATCCPSPSRSRTRRMYLACTQTESYDVAAEKGIGVLSSATFATNILAEHVKRYRTRGQAGDAGRRHRQRVLGQQRPRASAARTTREARELAALSLKTFFGPDKPYIRDRVNAYEQLLESWGGVPDHLKADFGRWLRQSDDAHKEQAAQVGISLDSGPGAARAAFGQMDPDTLCDRGIIIAGDPDSCIKGVQLYEEAGVDQVILIMQTETIPHERALQSHRDVRQARDSGVPRGRQSDARAAGG